MNRTIHRLTAPIAGLVLALLGVGVGAPALAQSPGASTSAVAPTRPVPVFGSVSPKGASSGGGTTITITGSHLAGVTAVKIGGSPATSLQVRPDGTRLTAATPAGLPGAQRITLVAPTGTSVATSASVLTYSDPAPASAASYVPQAATVVGTGVEWVTGGTAYTAPHAGPPSPWVVAIGPDGVLPEAGDPYFLAPGSAAYPRGLAGTVSAVATQAGGLVTATVTPSDLSAVLQSVSVSSAGPVGATSSQPTAPLVFGSLRPSSFTCANAAGEPRRFRGVLHLSLAKVSHRFALRTADSQLTGWVRYDASLSGTVTVPNQMTCTLRPEWAYANRKDVALPTAGLSLALVPQATFSTTADGTFAISQRSTRMVGIGFAAGQVRPVDARRNLGQSISAADRPGRLSSEIGVATQLAMLDRTGLDAAARTDAKATVTARTGPRRACVGLATSASYAATGFLDLWLPGAGSPVHTSSTALAPSTRCTDPVTPIEVHPGPIVRTDRLTAARNDTAYAQSLATTDGRTGTWSLVAGSLPAGLALDARTGTVRGTPTAHVGDHAFTVGFADAAGRRTAETVRLYVGPETSVAGGDFQATLTWGNEADLDLHVTDPGGSEIYYRHSRSPSGGELDEDSNAGCAPETLEANPVENIYWPAQQAPTGTYQVRVVRFAACGTTTQPWHLVVRAFGRVVLDKTGVFDSPETGNPDDSAPVYSVTLGDASARVTATR